ncbi:MAG: HAD-IIB family hydrolase, partial [bacterium]
MMTKKYLFFDLDGTLVSKTTYQMPKSSAQALVMTKNRGNVCFAVTGKAYGRCLYIRQSGIEDIVICDGAGLVYNNQLVYANPIDRRIVEETIRLIKQCDGHYAIMDYMNTYQDAYFYQQSLDFFLTYFPHNIPKEMMRRNRIMRIADYRQSDILKIDVYFDDEDQLYQFRHMLNRNLRYITVTLSEDDRFAKGGEIVMKGVSKADGVRRMMNIAGGSMKDTIGFGDSNRDIGLLKACQIAVALGDGSDRLKEAADYISDSVDDGGLAMALAHLDLM